MAAGSEEPASPCAPHVRSHSSLACDGGARARSAASRTPSFVTSLAIFIQTSMPMPTSNLDSDSLRELA
jgi:hypothetical protein